MERVARRQDDVAFTAKTSARISSPHQQTQGRHLMEEHTNVL